uniref:Transcription repressor n=1 Tax=Oryza punctata TaxID=4537 RepID=A0A0E0KX18_ORYPU
MVRKLVASLFLGGGGGNDACSLSSSSSTASSWQWPSCTQARTLSFARHDAPASADDDSKRRQEEEEDYCYKTSVMNPAFFLDDHSTCRSYSSASAVNMSDCCLSELPPAAAANDIVDDDEVIIRGLRSSNRRLFFEPESTSSIVVKGRAAAAAFDGATAMSIDSADPYGDFRRSMEEMVMSHMNGGAHDWGWLEEMLGWYLRANGKKTHGLIVGAFVDLVVALASSPSSATASSSSSGFQLLPLQACIKKGSQIN